jgi:hypothetical protein
MRMGKTEKKRRSDTTKATGGNKAKPKHDTHARVVGQLSPDLISTVFAPQLTSRAIEALERYSEDLVEYSDRLRAYESEKQKILAEFESKQQKAEEVDVEDDGTVVRESMVLPELLDPPVPPVPPLYQSQYWVNELQEVLNDTSEHFQAKNGGWKVHAKAARFERHLDEKYGRLRPLITNHPEIEQFVKNVQRKYAKGHFSPFRQGKPPIPRSAAVIILFMMQRGNLRWDVMVLFALFLLVGLQPWALVVIVAVGNTLLENRRRKPVRPMKTHIPAVEPYYGEEEDSAMSTEAKMKRRTDHLLQPVGKELGESEVVDTSDYDTIILGSGPATLYTAALLSRAGRKVLVLSPRDDASGCFEIKSSSKSVMEKFQSVAFDVEGSNIAKVSRQQALLAPALCTSSDYQGGIRFAQVGSDADGHAFEILSVPGMGTDGGEAHIPFVVRAAGVQSLMDDAAAYLGDGWPGMHGEVGHSACGSYLSACDLINASSNEFFLSKLLPDPINDARSKSTYHESAVRYASSFLEKGFPLNAHSRSLMAAIGMKGENIKPSMTSMGAHVTNICSAMSGEGMHYPIGGPRALCHALATVTEQSGGRILTGVTLAELLFDAETPVVAAKPAAEDGKEEDSKEGNAPRCIGVKLADTREIKFDVEKFKKEPIEPAIISMIGLVTTFIRLLPEDVRLRHKVPRGLPALTERRPVFKVLFGLTGSAADLNVTGADFYRLPGAALAQDQLDPITGQVKPGDIGWADDSKNDGEEVAVEAINADPSENPQGSDTANPSLPKKAKRRRNKFDAGVSWTHISFPSAKDPSFESRHGKITTCVVTIEADDDFVTPFETRPKLYAIQKKDPSSDDHQRLMERLKRGLLNIYPQLDGEYGTSFLL